MKVVFSLALLLLPLASVAEEFDFMYLAQQWPDSYCSTHKCLVKPPPPSHFTIHGLWPSYNKLIDGKMWLEDCNKEDPLDPTQIQDLEKQLDQKWPSLKQTNLEFWSLEWKKHGTCSNLGQHAYFEAALALERLTNLTKILADGGVGPSDVKTYTFREISDALARGTGFRTYFKCSKNKAGDTLLSEVRQCVDRYGEKLINCTALSFDYCDNADKIKMPQSGYMISSSTSYNLAATRSIYIIMHLYLLGVMHVYY
nr:intracellular ribonuclease LX [Oryza sativa Japonica Group]